MSLADKQSLALIAVVAGAMRLGLQLENEHNAIHFKFMRTHMQDAHDIAADVVLKWPCTGDNSKNVRWIVKRIEVWEKHLVEADARLVPLILVNISLNCVSDVYGKLHNKKKLDLLSPLWEPLTKLSNFLDNTGDKFKDYEYADALLAYLYRLMEFRR